MIQKNLHIAHVVECLGGGVNTYLRYVLPRLIQQGFTLTLICSLNRNDSSAEETLRHLRQHKVRILDVSMHRAMHPLRDTLSLSRLAWIFMNHRFDIVHTHGSKAGALGRVAAWLTGIGVRLHTPHCFAHLRAPSKRLGSLYLALERILGKITTGLLAVSPSESNIAINHNIIAAEKCTVILNALPASSNAERAIRTKEPFVVTTITRHHPGKGLSRFIDLANSWPHPHTTFQIVGVEKPANVPDYPNIQWLGFRHDIENIYKHSDVIVLASDAEGRPYVLLEAMRGHCAILATDVPGHYDLISHNQTGLLATTDIFSLQTELTRLHQDPDLRHRLSQNAHHECNLHTLDHQVNRLIETYDASVISSDRRCSRFVSSDLKL